MTRAGRSGFCVIVSRDASPEANLLELSRSLVHSTARGVAAVTNKPDFC
jgi:hypothetical protein